MTREQALLHTRATVLAQAFHGFVSPFETDLLEDIRRRRAAFGDLAQLTDLEAIALAALVDGLECAIRRMFAHPAVRAAIAASLERREIWDGVEGAAA